MVGMKLVIPMGDGTVAVSIKPKTESIRFSLRTNVPGIVKERQAQAAAYLEQTYSAVRENRQVPLSHRQAVALSGQLYRAWATDHESSQSISFTQNDAGETVRDYEFDAEINEAAYAAFVEKLDRTAASGDTAQVDRELGILVDRLLLGHGIASIDPRSRPVVVAEFRKALRQAMDVRRRKAGGDYSPDPKSERFPDWQSPIAHKAGPAVSLAGLVDSWWQEAKASGLTASTHESYRKAVTTLAAFLKHDDAALVSPDDIVAFKDHLLTAINKGTGKPLSAKTVKESYLSGLKSVFGWAVTNRKLSANPATGISVKVAKRHRLRDNWFTPDEIRSVLAAALAIKKGAKEPPQKHAAKRWVPWLCAYTGGRLGEMAQLRKQDIRHDGDRWVVRITPEAGRVKGKEQREVPLHPHLVEMGFPEFASTAADGHLFMWSGTDRAAWRTTKNRVTEFVRALVTDPNIAPNHGWRHTFKTIGSEAGIQDKVLDAICGHDPRTVGEGYGGVTMLAKAKAMELFPRFKVE